VPTSDVVNDKDSFYETFFLDKKSSDSAITFILPVGIGDVKITDECEKSLIVDVLKEFSE